MRNKLAYKVGTVIGVAIGLLILLFILLFALWAVAMFFGNLVSAILIGIVLAASILLTFLITE